MLQRFIDDLSTWWVWSKFLMGDVVFLGIVAVGILFFVAFMVFVWNQ